MLMWIEDNDGELGYIFLYIDIIFIDRILKNTIYIYIYLYIYKLIKPHNIYYIIFYFIILYYIVLHYTILYYIKFTIYILYVCFIRILWARRWRVIHVDPVPGQIRPLGSRCKTSPTLPAIQAPRAASMKLTDSV